MVINVLILDKLLGLLKRRPSVRVKGSPRIGLGGEVGTKSGAEVSPAPKVTFRDNPSGEVRKVKLQVSSTCLAIHSSADISTSTMLA
ncbi:hypothetical protein E2C01_091657 [Portunus trituberculatus]|uniref:Uncharacterized protein n=1 Tax=Portunus trituberculatus TaxID=210409 RepID=A0A5B7JNI4_PORTR|nr:hypothetical protein [Portunus trituberculatus]